MTTPLLWLPQAVHHLIPQTPTDPDIIPVGDVFHVAVSESPDLFELFTHDNGIESTGYILKDGSLIEYRPLTVECDAQFAGNSFIRGDGKRYGFNSWESQGLGTEPWTDQQLVTIKDIIREKHRAWGHPLRQAPAWNADGFGYHALFAQWNLSHHSCPGPVKIRQWQTIIVPWLNAGAPAEPRPTWSWKDRLSQLRRDLERAQRSDTHPRKIEGLKAWISSIEAQHKSSGATHAGP